ncbi:hypothetical protein C8R46DRAFT_111638 [Mycena filopes]|nr:hypothetical protein C8R46DRAFT_111638 [Mycena filopes]
MITSILRGFGELVPLSRIRDSATSIPSDSEWSPGGECAPVELQYPLQTSSLPFIEYTPQCFAVRPFDILKSDHRVPLSVYPTFGTRLTSFSLDQSYAHTPHLLKPEYSKKNPAGNDVILLAWSTRPPELTRVMLPTDRWIRSQQMALVPLCRLRSLDT